MKNFKRVMALLLTLIMVLSLTACGQPANQTTEAPEQNTTGDSTESKDSAASEAPTEAPTEDAFDPREICEGVTITIAVAEDNEVSDWETNAMTLAIEEALGVNLEFEVYAYADYFDKIGVMVNGGDKLPDIIFDDANLTGIKAANYTQWAEQEAIIPLTEYYNNPDYSKNIMEAAERCGLDLGSALVDGDGEIWGAPKYMAAPTNEVPNRMWINEEYCKLLGMDIPKTTEDFYQLCKAFKAYGDVNGNGIDDEIAFTGRGDNFRWFQVLMNPFVYARGTNYLVVENSEMYFAYTTEEWKEGLKYVKKFMDEGLIDPNALTQDRATYMTVATDIEAGLLADIYYQPQMVSDDKLLQVKTRLEYSYVEPFIGPEGRQYGSYAPVVPVVGAVITTECENPDAAFLVLDMLCSEELSISCRYGKRGENWDYWTEVQESLLREGTKVADYGTHTGDEPYIIAYNDGAYWGTGTAQNNGYMSAGPYCIQNEVYKGVATLVSAAEGDELAELTIEYNKGYHSSTYAEIGFAPAEPIYTLPMTADESTEVNDIMQTLNNYVKESIGAFLTGQWDIDGYWDTFQAELDKIGVDEALAIYQTSYNRTK